MNKTIRNYLWFLVQKTKIYFLSNEFKNRIKYVKGSIYSVIFGILISFIIILFNRSNPFSFFKYVFKLAFHPLLYDQTLVYWSIYIISGLSVAIAFKSGLFNVGVSGQMFISGSMTIILGLKNPSISQFTGIVSALSISILSGSLLAIFAGILKAYFNIHEVVTTIMLNWIVWYVMKWMFMNQSFNFWDSSINSTFDIAVNTDNFNLLINERTWFIPFSIAVFLVVLVSFIMNHTVLGYRISIVGKSKDVSLYAGINVKSYIIISMAISGAMAGILGMIYYMTQLTVLRFTVNSLPIIGFDGISIALVSYSNEISIIPVSLIWAVIKSSAMQVTQLPNFQISKQIGQLIFGILIYVTAISSLFTHFKPVYFIKKFFVRFGNLELKEKYKDYKYKIKKIKQEIKIISNEYGRNSEKNKVLSFEDNYIKGYDEKINDKLTPLYEEMNFINNEKKCFFRQYCEDYFFNIMDKNRNTVIRKKYNNKIINLINDSINNYNIINNKYNLKKHEISFIKCHYNKVIYKVKNKFLQKIYDIKNQYKNNYIMELIEINSKRSFLLKKFKGELRKVKEKYYLVFNNFCIHLKNKDRELEKKMKLEIKNLQEYHKKILKQFNTIAKFKINKIKKTFKKFRFGLKYDKNLKQKILEIKNQMNVEILKNKLEFCKKLDFLVKKRKKELPMLKNEFNKNINLIISNFKKNKKTLQQEMKCIKNM